MKKTQLARIKPGAIDFPLVKTVKESEIVLLCCVYDIMSSTKWYSLRKPKTDRFITGSYQLSILLDYVDIIDLGKLGELINE